MEGTTMDTYIVAPGGFGNFAYPIMEMVKEALKMERASASMAKRNQKFEAGVLREEAMEAWRACVDPHGACCVPPRGTNVELVDTSHFPLYF